MLFYFVFFFGGGLGFNLLFCFFLGGGWGLIFYFVLFCFFFLRGVGV